MGAQQQHKGMFLKHGGAGGGAKIFQQCHGGAGGGDFFPAYSRGGGSFFFFSPIDFAEPPPPPPDPAINNECSLILLIKTPLWHICSFVHMRQTKFHPIHLKNPILSFRSFCNVNFIGLTAETLL